MISSFQRGLIHNGCKSNSWKASRPCKKMFQKIYFDPRDNNTKHFLNSKSIFNSTGSLAAHWNFCIHVSFPMWYSEPNLSSHESYPCQFLLTVSFQPCRPRNGTPRPSPSHKHRLKILLAPSPSMSRRDETIVQQNAYFMHAFATHEVAVVCKKKPLALLAPEITFSTLAPANLICWIKCHARCNFQKSFCPKSTLQSPQCVFRAEPSPPASFFRQMTHFFSSERFSVIQGERYALCTACAPIAVFPEHVAARSCPMPAHVFSEKYLTFCNYWDACIENKFHYCHCSAVFQNYGTIQRKFVYFSFLLLIKRSFDSKCFICHFLLQKT